MKCWEQGDIDEKVMLWLSFNLCHDKGWGDKETEVHCSLLGSPGTPLVGLNQESMESNFDISQVTRFKTWQRQSQHTTPTMSRDGIYLLPSN